MKKIVLFTNTPLSPDGAPAFKPTYWTSYSELSDVVQDHGGQLFIAHGQHTYLGDGLFSRSWIIKDNVLKNAGPVTADLIFDKGRFISDKTVPVFNHADVSKVCNDKWLMFQTFTKFCPLTFFITNLTEFYSTLPKITTSHIVFKPYTGAEGIGVKIEEKTYFKEHETELIFPAVVSEFLDTSGGIPGIIEGTHDLRVAIFDGKILYSYVRTPPEGSLIANVSQGGIFAMVDLKKLPQDIIKITRTIDRHFSHTPHRFYGIDFAYTPQGYKIIEMNTELGLLPNADDPIFKTLKEKLATVFMHLS